jgi:hypothetical protein
LVELPLHRPQHHATLRLTLVFVAALNLAWQTTPAWGAVARFWITTSDVFPGDPDAPTVVAANGIARQFHVWAQPRTQFAGDYHATTNPFMTFDNVSLNIVSPQATFDIDPLGIHVANPTYSTANPRFQFVGDSSTGLTGTDGSAPGSWDDLPLGFSKGIIDINGFSIDSSAGDGFGVACDAADSACGITLSGQPAWLFASFSVTPTSDTGIVEFYLQVGRNGMTDVGAAFGFLEVEFGIDTNGLAPAAYDVEFDRQVTLANDDADLTLRLAGAGDYDADGDVDVDDYLVWRALFGTANYDADGNGDGIVDAADYTVWRDNLSVSPGSLLAAAAVPEPSAFVGLALAVAAMLTLSERSRISRRFFEPLRSRRAQRIEPYTMPTRAQFPYKFATTPVQLRLNIGMTAEKMIKKMRNRE